MSTKVLKSIRLPAGLIDRANERAELLGVSFSDVVTDTLATGLGFPRDPLVALLSELGSVVFTWFQGDFPPDVTRRVFLEIQSAPLLKELYDEAIAGEGGRPDDHRRNSVHREVGKLMRRLLHADPDGRALCPPGERELIQSYALLKPRPKAEIPF